MEEALIAGSETNLKEGCEDSSGFFDRRVQLSYKEFIKEYLKPNRPVLIEDAMKDWRALGNWTPDFFRRNYGSMDLAMNGLTMSELLDQIEKSRTTKPKTLPYLRNKPIDGDFPELRQDISPRPVYLEPNWFDSILIPKKIRHRRTDLFLGGAGSRFPFLHWDNNHTYVFLFQIYGEKEYVTYPPEQSAFLYPQKNAKNLANVSSIPDIENPDLLKFPDFAKAKPIGCVLKAGEMLFLPAGWWHTARMHTPSISVSINTANSYNWLSLMKDRSKMIKSYPVRGILGAFYLMLIWVVESSKDLIYRNRKLANQ